MMDGNDDDDRKSGLLHTVEKTESNQSEKVCSNTKGKIFSRELDKTEMVLFIGFNQKPSQWFFLFEF